MITRCPRRWAAAIALAALPVIAVSAAPNSLADDCTGGNMNSLNCMFSSGNGGFQPGDQVIPVGGGSPQIVAAPAPAWSPVVTVDGDIVIPAAPPPG